MSLKNNNQAGFALVEAVLIVVILGAVGFIGYKVMNRTQSTTSGGATTQTQASLPSKIQSKADVTKSVKALDSTPINSQLDPSQLDSNISSLL